MEEKYNFLCLNAMNQTKIIFSCNGMTIDGVVHRKGRGKESYKTAHSAWELVELTTPSCHLTQPWMISPIPEAQTWTENWTSMVV